MRARVLLVALAAATVAGFVVPTAVTAGEFAVPAPGAPACSIFPANNYWHADVSTLPVHARSNAWLESMGGADRRLHPDFGPSGGELPYGIPYAVVGADHPDVAITFEYDTESDQVPYPFGPEIPIEGGADADGDRHALMIDRDACRLYELFDARWNDGAPTAGSGAVYDLGSNALRPAGWTSADAAGLPIFAGLVRRDEVLAGNIDHAIRITAASTSRAYLWPARHFASSSNNPNLPPMGAWFRMKASFDISRYSAHTQTILRAFKKHGAIVADNGSNWYFTGAADEGWESSVLNELKSIPAGAFEAIDASGLMIDADSGQVTTTFGAPAPPPGPTATVAPATTAPTTTAAPTTRRVPATPSVSVTTPPSTTPEADVPTTPKATTATTFATLTSEAAAGSAPDPEVEREFFEPSTRSLTPTPDDGVALWLWIAIAVTLAAIAATTISVRGRLRRRQP